jgi:hypothetical protein
MRLTQSAATMISGFNLDVPSCPPKGAAYTRRAAVKTYLYKLNNLKQGESMLRFVLYATSLLGIARRFSG